MRARDAADRGGRVHQAAVGRHPGDRDKPHAIVDHPLQRLRIEHAVGIVRDDVDGHAGALGDLQERDVVRRVFGAGGEDAVAGPERQRIEGHLPRHRGILDQRDLVPDAPIRRATLS